MAQYDLRTDRLNIAEDPEERDNRADEHPDRVKYMLQELDAWFSDVEADRSAIEDIWR